MKMFAANHAGFLVFCSAVLLKLFTLSYLYIIYGAPFLWRLQIVASLM